jgi:hypothetical protein
MGNSPVTLDFSKAQPLTLDFSKAEPLDGPAQTSGATPGASQITGIRATPAPSGMREKAERYLQNVADDLKYGTDVTGFGSFMKGLGAHGLYNGNPESVGDFLGSPLLGTLRAAKGGAEITQEGKTWQGTKDIVGGAGEALQIPGAFMGGPGVSKGAEAADLAVGKVFGDAEKAGQLFNKVAAAKDTPIEVTDDMYAALNQAKDLAAAGAKGLPRVITKFFNRVDSVDQELTWDEARRFYTNVSRLSANEYQSMAPQMASAVSRFGAAFSDSLRAAAEASGVGEEYGDAMQLYSKAKSWQKFGANAWSVIKDKVGSAIAGAAGGGATYEILQALHGNKR